MQLRMHVAAERLDSMRCLGVELPSEGLLRIPASKIRPCDDLRTKRKMQWNLKHHGLSHRIQEQNEGHALSKSRSLMSGSPSSAQPARAGSLPGYPPGAKGPRLCGTFWERTLPRLAWVYLVICIISEEPAEICLRGSISWNSSSKPELGTPADCVVAHRSSVNCWGGSERKIGAWPGSPMCHGLRAPGLRWALRSNRRNQGRLLKLIQCWFGGAKLLVPGTSRSGSSWRRTRQTPVANTSLKRTCLV